MEFSIIGSGYINTTITAYFAELGYDVVNVGIDEGIVASLSDEQAPIHEPGLAGLVEWYTGNRLRATADYNKTLDTNATFLALPTPPTNDDGVDLGVMKAVATSPGKTLVRKDDSHLVVTRGTVVPWTTVDVIGLRIGEVLERRIGDRLDIATDPEFLRGGTAVDDSLSPDKIALGARTDRAYETLAKIFAPLVERAGNPPVVRTGVSEAKMTEHVNNAFPVSKAGLANDLANICKVFGVDPAEVLESISPDSRIESTFLGASFGRGGSCLPEDTAAIVAATRAQDYEPRLLQAVVDVNNDQLECMLDLLHERFDLDGECVAVLGLAFKPGTDGIWKPRVILFVQAFLNAGVGVANYDPVAIESMRKWFPDINYTDSATDVLANTSATLVATDRDEFAALGDEFDTMRERIVVGGHRIVTRREGLDYESLV